MDSDLWLGFLSIGSRLFDTCRSIVGRFAASTVSERRKTMCRVLFLTVALLLARGLEAQDLGASNVPWP
jgi:hypothetical protein